jgi:hypothetical protein
VLIFYGLLRKSQKPRTTALVIAGLHVALIAVLGVVLALIIAMDAQPWRPNYAGPISVTAVAAGVILFGVLTVLGQPRLLLRSWRGLEDSPHSLEAFFSFLFVTAAQMTLLPGTAGFVGAFIFRDFRFFAAAALLGWLAIIPSWPTAKRWAGWADRMRAKGSLRSPQQAL